MRAKQRLAWKRQAGTLVSTKRGVNRFPVQGREMQTAPLPSSREPSGGTSPLPRRGASSPQRPTSLSPPAAHSQAGTSSRKSAFCVRSRCRSCRTMWRFQTAAGAQGAPGEPGPAMAAQSPAIAHSSRPSGPGGAVRGGASRGLLDVKAVAAGNPRAVPSASGGRGELGALRQVLLRPGQKTSTSKELVSVPGVSSLPDACGRVRGGASGSRSLTSLRLDQCQMLSIFFAATEAGRGDSATPGRTGTGSHQAQAV